MLRSVSAAAEYQNGKEHSSEFKSTVTRDQCLYIAPAKTALIEDQVGCEGSSSLDRFGPVADPPGLIF